MVLPARARRTGMAWAVVHEPEPGVLGCPPRAPYDRILVSADGGRLPGELVEQLAVPGRLVVPVSGLMTVVDKTQEGLSTSAQGHYRFVPLL
jgi:protein-L-isoaspartate(D-aspartate) O-methyltransferase